MLGTLIIDALCRKESEPKSMDEQIVSTRKNRYKILYVPNDLLLDILFTISKHVPMCVKVPLLKEIPEDIEVVGTWYSAERDAVGFKLYHESFDPLPQGSFVPLIVLEHVLLKTIETKPIQPVQSYVEYVQRGSGLGAYKGT